MSFANTIDGPWIPSDQIPKELSHHFSLQSDPLRRAQMQEIQQRDAQGEGSFAAHKDKPAHELTPPQGMMKHPQSDDELLFRHWLKQQWLSAVQSAYRREAREPIRDDHLLPQPLKENQTMTQSNNTKNAPVKTFRDGAATIKLWGQQGKDKTFYTASVGKIYKDGENWKESRSFNETDLLKLQAMIPEARQEMQRLQERSHEQAEPIHDMATARDTAMQGADMAEQQRANTQEHAQEPSHQPSLDHSR